MADGLRSRIFKGVAANGFGQAVTSLINLVQVPLLFAKLGQGGFTDWTVLSAIPSQLALSDLGFGAAATSEMTRLMAREDEDGALGVFQSCWALITVTSAVSFVLASLFVLLAPWVTWLHITTLTEQEARGLGLALVAFMLAQQQLSLVAAAYKSSGHYALVTVRENWVRLSQSAGSILVLFATGSLIAFASAYMALFLAGVAWLSLDMRRHAPWARWGFQRASWATIKPLIKPAISFMAFPFALSLNQQGFINLITATLGAPALAAWSSLRTLSRVIVQATQALNGPSWIELSRALGRKDWPLARRMHGAFLQISVLVSLALGAILLAVCPWFYPIFTNGKVPYQPGLLFLLILAATFSAIWNVAFTVAMAGNRHSSLTAACLLLNALGLGAAFILGRQFGVTGVALSLAGLELLMIPICWKVVFPHMQETLPGLLSRMKSDPRTLLRRSAPQETASP